MMPSRSPRSYCRDPTRLVFADAPLCDIAFVILRSDDAFEHGNKVEFYDNHTVFIEADHAAFLERLVDGYLRRSHGAKSTPVACGRLRLTLPLSRQKPPQRQLNNLLLRRSARIAELVKRHV